MRFILALTVLWMVWVGHALGRQLSAQEVAPEEPASLPVASPIERVAAVFNAPDASDHAGLLGKIYLQCHYQQQDIEDRRTGGIWKGFDTLLNLPAVTMDTPVPLDIDLFAGYSNFSSTGRVWPQTDLKSEAFNMGATIYPTRSKQWRPFVQVGARFIHLESRYDWRGFPVFLSPDPVYNKHDTRLLLNTGFEYDIFDSLAYRMTLFTETKDKFRDSFLSHDLILWPVNRIFIRGGVSSDVEFNRLGFTIGGGLAF